MADTHRTDDGRVIQPVEIVGSAGGNAAPIAGETMGVLIAEIRELRRVYCVATGQEYRPVAP